MSPAETTAPIRWDVLDVDRWLDVTRVRDGARGAWATGAFDVARNRLALRQKDAAAFAVDVSEIPIDWTRPVVLSIDDVASELRRRDEKILHFERDRRGQWIILEPPKDSRPQN